MIMGILITIFLIIFSIWVIAFLGVGILEFLKSIFTFNFTNLKEAIYGIAVLIGLFISVILTASLLTGIPIFGLIFHFFSLFFSG